MDQDPGIIRVVDPNEEQEDEALVALRALPKFEPLVVPDAPPHFSLTSVFGAFSTSADSRGASTELAFNPSVLVDILVQINGHSKRCGQDIQEFQRSLGTKMRALDDFTSGAVQELTAIHQQAKTNSGELLSVHALSKQAQTTTTLLHGIVDKLNLISDALPTDAGVVGISESAYPHLYQYLHQPPEQHHHRGYTSTGATKSSSIESSPEKHDAVESETYGYYCGYVCDRNWCNDNNGDKSGVPTSALCTIANDSACSPQGSGQYGASIEFTQLSSNAVNINIRSGLHIREPGYGCW
ncbi:hypothetical protein EC957_001857 [Mortierella hygrophila]|uniref:Uncharacterized protein n=1 Tax=Mortierella hygrophila TaxID=979708 RepID=A0A9P6K1L2_9FUNG|nr:hypothetical protein EC957_001857 [Mortierella hygrophila]